MRYSIAVLILFGFLLLAVRSAQTKEPWEDESWFGTATFHLAETGSLATDVLEGAGTWRAGMRRHFYWEPPLSFVVNAAVVKVFGFSLLTVRSVSIAFGLLAILSTFALVWKLTGSADIGLLAIALVSFDYFFLLGSSDGRMDAMCMALGLSGIASYVLLRDRSLAAAVVVSQTCVMASGLTHPNGVIWFVGLLFITVGLDLKRLRPRTVALACLPYIIGAAGWGAFIAQDPQDFKIQFLGNVQESGNSNGSLQHPLKNPLKAIGAEITERYAHPFGLAGARSFVNRLKGLVLSAYLMALVVAIASRSIRHSAVGRCILTLIAIAFFMMTFVDGNKMSYYLIHITPLLAIITALVLWSAMERRGIAKWVAVGVAAGLVCLQAGGVWYRIRENTYQNMYLPTISVIRMNTGANDLIIGTSALFWSLHTERTILDDFRLGFYSHKQGDVIVLSPFYKALEAQADGGFRSYLNRTLPLYDPVPFQGEYEILARKR
jgi:4-amino-4-deoxy-L-arabinose transferase-like glycosyltransferase